MVVGEGGLLGHERATVQGVETAKQMIRPGNQRRSDEIKKMVRSRGENHETPMKQDSGSNARRFEMSD